FVNKVWEYKHEYASTIMNQFRCLGASYDWSRECFLLDDMLTRATRETFVRMFNDGIIYRSSRLVNWCHHVNTSLSNLEVENLELTGSTTLSIPGYPAKEDSDERIIVATTRIETMLGDTAIAVHPDDGRYKHLHGKFVRHTFVDRRIPSITDAECVDMELGTGAVKITPAHDYNDYNRHLHFHVHKQIIEDIKAKGLYVNTVNNSMSVPQCPKSYDIIEPHMKPQWWVKQLAEPALQALRDGRLEIAPLTSESEWFRWVENINDWCIYRQLWWGHRIPTFFNDSCDGNYWVAGHTEADAKKRAEEKFPGVEFELEQDPDVLDTWFSSGLWPFAVLGWPENTDDFKKYYPTSLLEM
ncbi:valine--tRNA ligase, partial [Coemansia sp. 'formosensis']